MTETQSSYTLTHLLYERLHDHDCPELPCALPGHEGGLWAGWVPFCCPAAVALLCPQLHCECRGPGLRFLSYPKGSRTAPLGSTLLGGGAQPGLLSGLVVMFLPERWTPGSTTPQLMLHKMLVGSAKCRPATVLGQPGSTNKIFQKALPSLLVKERHLCCSPQAPTLLPPQQLFYPQEQLGVGSARHKCVISHPPWKLTALAQPGPGAALQVLQQVSIRHPHASHSAPTSQRGNVSFL